ncbi:OPT/YSL family transporter [Candidatus Parcubacteria bacterium]|nr:OPT/YSL family transporter [Candidatus Parcubacteria bacterium]
MNNTTNNLEEVGETGFSLRAVVVAISLTLFLLVTSSYITLKLGALPWPIIFSAIIAGAVLNFVGRIGKKTNVHEINVAQAGGTIGGLMAAGITFTIPGILYLQQKGIDVSSIDVFSLILVCLAAGILGILLSVPIKRVLVDEENLPYPSGAAGAEVVKAEVFGGRNAFIIVIALLLTGLFVILREMYFPGGWILFSATGLTLLLYPMPLAIGIGYILGKRASFNWFLGAVVGWVLIIPYLINSGWERANATSLVQNLGMGMVLGSGIGFFIATIIPKAKKLFSPLFDFRGAWYTRFTIPASLFALLILYAVGVPLFAAVLTIFGVWIMATVAARMTGETDIDPLEQFGIIVGLAVLGLYALLRLELDYLPAFIIVCFVSIACALAGDIGHDYKSAKIIGTKAKDIIKVDLIAVVCAGIAGPFVLEIIQKGYGSVMFTELMPAPQAQLVANSIFGFAYPQAFFLGLAIAFLVVVGQKIFKKAMFILPMVAGIGMFLGLTLGLLLAVGGIIKYFVDRKFSTLCYSVMLVAAGIIGGEGIAGFSLAAFYVAGMNAAIYLGIAFVLLLLVAIHLRLASSKQEI